MFRPTPELEVGCTVAFRFPDGLWGARSLPGL